MNLFKFVEYADICVDINKNVKVLLIILRTAK